MAFRLARLDLPPDVFAVVMATGIVSTAAQRHHETPVADALGVLAGVVFVVLALGLVVRVVARPGSALGELTDPDVALRLFTSVAACAVLANRYAAQRVVVWPLAALGTAAWLLLAGLSLRDMVASTPTDLRDQVHGAWLLPSVASSGLSIVASDLAGLTGSRAWLAAALPLWLLGLVVYCAVVGLVAWRVASRPLLPDEAAPDSWILMGALAIGTVAGAHLLEAGGPGWASPVTVIVFVVATLWIPVLLYASVWRADHRPGSLHYTGVWWSAVFPLGMYAVACSDTAGTFDIGALDTVSLVFFWDAAALWLIIAIGLGHAGMMALRNRDRPPARR